MEVHPNPTIPPNTIYADNDGLDLAVTFAFASGGAWIGAWIGTFIAHSTHSYPETDAQPSLAGRTTVYVSPDIRIMGIIINMSLIGGLTTYMAMKYIARRLS